MSNSEWITKSFHNKQHILFPFPLSCMTDLISSLLPISNQILLIIINIYVPYITFLYMFCTLPSVSTTYIFIIGCQYLWVSFTFKSYVQLHMNLRNDGPIQSLTHSDECKFKNTTSMQILQFVMFKYGGWGKWTANFITTLQNTAILDWFWEF